jgi:hypothetical protein
MELAIAYDWLYNDLDAATRTAFMNQLEQYVTTWEGNYAGVGASPYNDVFYIRYGPDGMPAALAIYPDYDDANPTGGSCPKKPCGTYHINYMMDKWFNVFVPVWHQVMGNSGGGWHENWDAYVNPPNGPGLTQWLVPSLLSWQGATGDPIFTKNPWLKNFAYLTMYMTRPDMTMQHIGEVSGGYLTNEYSIANADLYNIGVPYGSLNGLAEIYDDPALRGWARLVNQELASGPTGFEPSAWPFYTPDSNAKAVAPRSSLSTVHLFDGWGVIDARSGWGEDDTDVTFKYGDNFWSHSKGDTGSFTITHKGNLAINSGTYRAGSGSTHEWQYGRQTIAHNSLLIVDPNDYYPNQTFPMQWADGSVVSLPMANDGGQRRAGNPYNANNALFNNLGGAPKDIAAWNAASDYFHMGTLVAYEATPEYVYAAADITPAYNNPESSTQPNAVNRTKRATSVIRSMLFIRPGYVIIYDEVNATDATFKKKWLLHSVNQPLISGNRFEIDRTELVQPAPYADLWTQQWANVLKNDNASYQYKYGGKLIGWMVQPTGSINAVGGPGKEFWIEDPKNPGSGTNWNQCTPGQCQGDYSFLSPNKPDFMEVNPNYAPVEPGSWRIEESPSTAQTQDYFLNVMLATNYEDPNVPATVTGTSDSGTVGATWSDGKNTYAIKFARSGVGGHITVTGSSTIDKDLGTGVGSSLKPASCDINGDGVVNAADVQAAMDQALGALPCTTANLHNTGTCTVVDVQRVIAASLGGACVTGQ